MKNDNQRLVFDLPEESELTEVLFSILKDNNLEESDEEYFNKSTQNKEPRAIVIRDMAFTMAEKKFPEKKVLEYLEKHLEIKKHEAQQIIKDINEKLIPFAKIIDVASQIQEENEEKVRKKEKIDPRVTAYDQIKLASVLSKKGISINTADVKQIAQAKKEIVDEAYKILTAKDIKNMASEAITMQFIENVDVNELADALKEMSPEKFIALRDLLPSIVVKRKELNPKGMNPNNDKYKDLTAKYDFIDKLSY